MIEKKLLLRIKLRNGKMKIILAGSVKFTLKRKKKLGKEKKNLGYSSNTFRIMAVTYQYRFSTNNYKLLLSYLFNRLVLAF